MEIDFLGSSRSVPIEIRDRTVAKVGRLGRLAPLLEEAEIRLIQDGERPGARRWACQAVLRGHGHELRSRAEATDPLGAVDAVVEKLEHQVEKLKGKLLARSHPRHESSA
jgi:ribosomal subunit interface protein